MLRVAKGDQSPATNAADRVFAVDASQATIFGPRGARLDFTALAVGQKVEIAGALSDRGVVEARAIRIEGPNEPTPGENRAAASSGTVLAIDREAQTFDLRLEHLRGHPAVLRAAFPNGLPAKLTVKWNDRTIFFEDERGDKTAADLVAGQRVIVRFAEFAPPFLAAVVRMLDARAEGVVTDISGLPESFVIAARDFAHLATQAGTATGLSTLTRPTTVQLTSETRIISIFGERLTPRAIMVGAEVSVQGQLTAPNTITAELVVVGGIELKGSVTPADVNAAAMTFNLTLASANLAFAAAGEKVAVKTSDRTLIFVDRDQARQVPIKASEFFRLISEKPYRLEVVGLISPETARTVQALKIKLMEPSQ
jgi:hypothetical protein